MCAGTFFFHRAGSAFANRFLTNFGWKFAVQLSVMYIIVKGVLNSTMGLVQLSYCKKTLEIDGTACQTMGAIASTPWAIKGAIGVVSDAYPLFGYHKASYIIVAGIMGTCAFGYLATMPIHTASVAAGMLFLTNFEVATADLLCEGKYAELMQAKPKTGSTMVSYVWGCFQIGSLIAALFVGPVAGMHLTTSTMDASRRFACVPLFQQKYHQKRFTPKKQRRRNARCH